MRWLHEHAADEQWNQRIDCSPGKRVHDFMSTKSDEERERVRAYISEVIQSPPEKRCWESEESYILRFQQRKEKIEWFEKLSHIL
jgi:hypothetical protein